MVSVFFANTVNANARQTSTITSIILASPCSDRENMQASSAYSMISLWRVPWVFDEYPALFWVVFRLLLYSLSPHGAPLIIYVFYIIFPRLSALTSGEGVVTEGAKRTDHQSSLEHYPESTKNKPANVPIKRFATISP